MKMLGDLHGYGAPVQIQREKISFQEVKQEKVSREDYTEIVLEVRNKVRGVTAYLGLSLARDVKENRKGF